MFQLDTADPRRKRMLDGGEADTPDGGEAVQARPPITAASASGPVARVPAPQVGAPSGQPLLQAPQSVAQLALGARPPVATGGHQDDAPVNPRTTEAGNEALRPSAGAVPRYASAMAAPLPDAPPAGSPAPAPAAPAPQVGPPAPIKTLSGEWTPPTSAPTSAPLIASAAGGTMTPQGDLGNTLRGYQSAEGGTFGQADTGDRAQALRALESVSGLDTGTTYQNGVYAGGDPTKFGLSPNATSAEITALSKQNGLIANGDPAAIKAGLSSSNPWLKANAEREAAKHPEIMQPGAVSRLAGNATAADPALQARLLASGATAAGVGQAGPIAPQVGAPPAAAPSPAGPAGVPGVPSGGAPAVGGGGTPAFPSTPAPAFPAPTIGAPGDLTDLDPVQKAMRDETLRRLQNPSPYDDALWQKEVDKAKASSDETWKRNRDSLDADLAARGINWSSIAGDKLSDFNTARSRSWDDTLTGFLSDRAKGIGAARDQAFNAGNTERSYYDNLRQQAIGNQFDVTRLQEALRQGREGTALDWTRLGLGALGQSADNSADIGSGLAQSAAGTNTGDYLAQWIAQFYGKRAPKPAIGDPNANMTP